MNSEASITGSGRVAAAVYVAKACYAFSHEDGWYQHAFSSDFQIPGHVLHKFGVLEIPDRQGYPGAFRWLVDKPAGFEEVIQRNLETGPTHEEVLIAMAFCFMDLTDEQFDLLVAEGVFEANKESKPNLWGKLSAEPVLTPYGHQLEQRWLSWSDQL